MTFEVFRVGMLDNLFAIMNNCKIFQSQVNPKLFYDCKLTLSTLLTKIEAKYLSAEVLLIVTVLSFLNTVYNSYLRNIQAVAQLLHFGINRLLIQL